MKKIAVTIALSFAAIAVVYAAYHFLLQDDKGKTGSVTDW